MRKFSLFLSALLMGSLLQAQNLPSYVPANGLVGWWPFNGNSNDESGNNLTNNSNGLQFSSDRFGNPSSCMKFSNDTNSFFTSNIPFNANSTIGFWLKQKSPQTNFPVPFYFHTGNYSTDEYTFYCNSSNGSSNFNTLGIRLGTDIGTPPSNWYDSSIPYSGNDSSWNYITVTMDNQNKLLSIYKNSILASTLTFQGQIKNFSKINFGHARKGNMQERYVGSLDDIAIYNRALSQQEITALYQGANTSANCPTFPSSLAQGLVGYWPFCGNALDESGNNNHGTVNGATLTSDRFGNAGSAYSFDGATSYVQVPNSTSLSNIDSITISAWVNINSWFVLPGNNSNFFPILNKSNTSENGKYSLYLTQNNGNAFQFGNQNVHNFQYNFGLDNWYHITCRFTGGQYSAFVNGIQVDGSNFPFVGVLNNDLPLLFGKDPSGEVEFSNGILDDIAIWNRALTPQEIQQVYNQGICQTSITVTDTLLIHTGITSYNPVAYGNTLKVWPNPGNQDITLDAGNLSRMQGWKYKVANTLGQTVVNETAINQQQTLINLSTWGGNGIYYLHLINPQGHAIEIKKIVLAP